MSPTAGALLRSLALFLVFLFDFVHCPRLPFSVVSSLWSLVGLSTQTLSFLQMGLLSPLRSAAPPRCRHPSCATGEVLSCSEWLCRRYESDESDEEHKEWRRRSVPTHASILFHR